MAKVLLVAVTVICLLSMGGAMLFAAWVLVPLHWMAARTSGPVATGGWAFLAGLSLFEAGWMLTWVATEQAAVSVAVGLLAFVATIVGFLVVRADRVAAAAH